MRTRLWRLWSVLSFDGESEVDDKALGGGSHGGDVAGMTLKWATLKIAWLVCAYKLFTKRRKADFASDL